MFSSNNGTVLVVLGLGYGDEGKGSVVDYLVRQYEASLVVRFNGGSQAAHHVVSPEGLTHCFSQFGSGTLVPGVETFLSSFMLVDPLAINVENEVLRQKGVADALERLIISEYCPVITRFHKILNRMLEVSRGKEKHGSCGQGVGQAANDLKCLGENALLMGDLKDKVKTIRKLDFLWRIKTDLAEQLVREHPDNERLSNYLEEIRETSPQDLADSYYDFVSQGKVRIADKSLLAQLLVRKGNTVFEGAQGVLLDRDKGQKPYVTQTNTTLNNAQELLAGTLKNVVRIGIWRGYLTRHGPGPLISEDEKLTAAIPDCHNLENEWQGKFRLGWFDLMAARYALEIAGDIDCLAITNLDRLASFESIPVCTSYDSSVAAPKPIYGKEIKGIDDYLQFLEEELKKPISLVSFGPSAKEKFKLKALC
jgi:adenylosuccinate synthase